MSTLPEIVTAVRRSLNKAKKLLLTPLVLATFLETHSKSRAISLNQTELSLAALCQAYPRRIRRLFSQLDLTQLSLQSVRLAVAQQDWVAACESLVLYYESRQASCRFAALDSRLQLRAHVPYQPVLSDIFTFQKQTGKVPRCPDGRLNWAFRGPRRDCEWAWFLNRHYHFLGLLKAYRRSQDSRYMRCLNEHLVDWITSSFDKPQQWWARWRGREVALRSLHWASVFYCPFANLTPAVRILMLLSLLDHACYLRHLHAWGANWLCREMTGLAAIALCWSEFKQSERWLSTANHFLLQELDRQVYPDGVHKELTSHYHRIVLHDFQIFADLLELADRSVPTLLRLRLEQMINYLAYSMCPQGRGLLNNDSDHDYNRALVRTAATVYDRQDWAHVASSGAVGQPPQTSVVFPWAGQVIYRSDWTTKAHWSFFDVGPLGINYHIHYDKLHVSIAAYGRHLLVDSGRYRYVPDAAQQYFRASASHNVILMDGKGQGSECREWQQPMTDNYSLGSKLDFAWGTFNGQFSGLKGRATHTRALLYLRNRYWVVVDRIISDRPRQIEPLWHFHPDCWAALEGDTVATSDPGLGNLRIVPAAPFTWSVQLVAGQTNPMQGWWSREYNHRVANPTAVYAAKIPKAATFAWVLYPAQGKVPAVAAELLPAPAGTIRLRVAEQGHAPDEIAVNLSSPSAIALSDGYQLVGRCAVLPAEQPPIVGQGILFDRSGNVVAAAAGVDASKPVLGGQR